MFYYISKFFVLFLSPALWIVILLTWRFFTKSSVVETRLFIIIILLILFFGNEFIYTKLVNAWQPRPVQLPSNHVYDAGILLGGLESFDRYGTGFLNSAADRLVEICTLYKSGSIKKIIVSAGGVHPNEPREYGFLRKKIIALGIPPADVIMEERSRTTFENALFSKKIIDSMELKPPFILVTSAIHMPRAESAYKKAGLLVIAFPTNYNVLEKKFGFLEYFVPSLQTIEDWDGFLKEVAGLAGYKLFNRA